jgi:hypothetical protein
MNTVDHGVNFKSRFKGNRAENQGENRGGQTSGRFFIAESVEKSDV